MTDYTLNLEARARDAVMNGFTLSDAIGEAIGYASLCWSEAPLGVFDSERAATAAADLQRAMAKFLEIAINQQSIDADLGTPDWQVVELILQAPAIGWDSDRMPEIQPGDLRDRLQRYTDIQRQTIEGLQDVLSGLARIAKVDTTELEGTVALLGHVADDLDKILAGDPLQAWLITGEIDG